MYAERVTYESRIFTIVSIKSNTAVSFKSFTFSYVSFDSVYSLGSRACPHVPFKSLHAPSVRSQMLITVSFSGFEFFNCILMPPVSIVSLVC